MTAVTGMAVSSRAREQVLSLQLQQNTAAGELSKISS